MSYRWRNAAVLILALTSPVLPQGRRPTFPQPFTLENADKFAFRILEDDQGGFYLLWTHAQGKSYTLLVQRVDAVGQAAWPTGGFPVGGGLASPDIWQAVPDSKGGLVVLWQQDFHICAQRIAPDRQCLWPKERYLVSVSTYPQRNPAGAPDGNGGVYLVWEEKLYADRWVLLMQHINPQGAALWPAVGSRVSLRPSGQRWPLVSYDGQGGMVAAWKDFRESASQLMAQRADFQGNLAWDVQGVLVTAPAGDTPERPLLEAGGDGSALLAWRAPQGGANGIFVQRVDSSGSLSWNLQGLSVSRGNWDQWSPYVLGDGEGGVWVSWVDYRNQIKWQCYIQHFGKEGKPAWSVHAVSPGPGTGDQGHVVLIGNGRRGLFAAWLDNRSGTPGIYLQELDSQGQLLRGPEGMKIADGFKDPTAPQIVNVAPEEAIICWADRQNNRQWALYWERVKKLK